MNPYSHLKIKPSKEFIKQVKSGFFLHKYKHPKLYSLFFLVTKFISKFKIIRKIASTIIDFNRYKNNSIPKTLRSIELLKINNHSTKANNYESEFGYDEFTEIEALFHYYKEIKNNFPNSQSESKKLYLSIEEIYSLLINKYGINNFLNFGGLLGHADSILAKKFPETNFICTDRSTYTKIINEEMYRHIKNMTFIDGDIFNFLSKKNFSNDLFFSTRTLTLLSKEFIEELYKSVYKSGFKYISLLEQIGISHDTSECYSFSDEDKSSVAYRSGMYLHNYPGILRKCGYKVIESKLIKTDHPHEDYRFLYIFAEKI